MIMLALALAYAPPADPPTPPEVSEEIVVVGERLKTWRGRITPAGAALRCVTTTSTGDPEVDAIGCGAMVACFTPLRPRMQAALARPRRERAALMAPIEREVGACMMERRDQLIAGLAERRYAARQED